jgi:hypothetical protein
MGVNTPKAFKTAGAQPVLAQVRDRDMIGIAHDDIGNLSFPGDEQGNLSFNVVGYRRNLACQLMRNDLMAGYPSAVKSFES